MMRLLSALSAMLAVAGSSSSFEEPDGRRGKVVALDVAAETFPRATSETLAAGTGEAAAALGPNKKHMRLPVSPGTRRDGLVSRDSIPGVPKAAAVVSAMLKVPIVAEDNPLRVIPGLVQEISPEWNAAPSQSRILEVNVQPATDAFLQSSPTPTDSPSVPTKPSPPSRPELSTFYITITGAPVTRTILDTTTLTHTITPPVPPPPSPTIVPPENVWNPPGDFANLDCFGILKYGFGKSNLQVVHGIPPSASASVSSPAPTGTLEWTNEMSAIEAFFPKGSINPGNSPQGGADFYANPLPALKDAQNVTFGYSVFLPVDFEPVRGGKLPGLYGGKTGCSGGDAALDCFSTRLMWRAKNDGELYLYAPKDKQTDDVCNTPPRSICEADYGLSIGRGSFKFTPGQWTHVSQTVVLNTPGRQDGYFTLDVNGKRILDLQGVYYRQTAADEDEDDEQVQSASTSRDGLDATSANGGNASGQDTGTPNPSPNVESPPASGEDEGLLGHILLSPRANSGSAAASVWHAPGRHAVLLAPNPRLRHQHERRHVPPSRPLAPAPPPSPLRPDVEDYTLTVTKVLRPTMTVISHVTETRFATIAAQPTPPVVNFATKAKVPGFSGIFFSTFFGGHEQNFATPKDQKMWFKDFELVVNE